ncbi:hypothetical protein G6O69_29390 [Pseudenhygromyxa sp. WMMC2535]|uniref:hypothetical protein n=1 Tax=Pseudenhygromyxa sp. WMMC2535 TaxID=2712867 RepID=UPI001552F307|nr:hypothetical protein [Pseudenhygromyxa sp. WMMC2535]NVB41977.1 hypothetical protein [Pseudenhygromyxa sp. WMMC2535]
MGCCDFSQAKLEDESQLMRTDTSAQVAQLKAAVARVSVAPSGGGDNPRVNTLDLPPPPIYYVIVGFGPAAVMNHTTLRGANFGRRRIGNLRVMHIGFNNPWPQYVEHGMGQVPFLLTMPGFAVQPNVGGRVIDGGLHSRDFGNAINAQFAALKGAHGNDIEECRGWVAWVQHRDRQQVTPPLADFNAERQGGTELHTAIVNYINLLNARNEWPDDDEAVYRLIVVGLNQNRIPQLRAVYAAYIDFCTGPGRPNVFMPGGPDAATTALIEEARTAPWLPPEAWSADLRNRRVLNGVDAIVDQVQWNANERIMVTAGGGVGLNAAEKARNVRCFLDWIARNTLNDTFANPRNHTFLRSPNGGPMAVYELDQVAPFHDPRARYIPEPPDQRQRFGRKLKLDKLEIVAGNAGNMVAVSLDGDNRNAVIIDSTRVRLGLIDPPDPTNALNLLLNIGAGKLMLNCSVGYLQAAERLLGHASGWPSLNYDRLVIPNGQDSQALGQPIRFTEIQGIGPLTLADGRMAALQSNDQRVRMLGAACQVYNQYALASWNRGGATPRDRMWSYHSTLAVSAVPDGFILSGINIANANQFFAQKHNININTMTVDEIQAMLPALANYPANSQAVAHQIVACRHRANGYANFAALMNVVNAGQAQIPPLTVNPPANWQPGPNDGPVPALNPPLLLADAAPFAVFRYGYP